MTPARLAALAFTLAIVSPAPGHANGRFPRAQKVYEQDGDPERLVLAATYGLLFTNDGGAEWRHLCELGFAFANAEIDPLVGTFSDGSLVVRGIRSLNRAESPYCDFAPVLAGRGTDTVADFSLDPSTPDRVVGLVLQRAETGLTDSVVYDSLDAGRSFVMLGRPLPADDVSFGITLDVSPTDPLRLYATALGRKVPAVFVRSDDGGESWTTSALAVGPDEHPYIAGIAPNDANAIYVRTDSWASVDGVYEANDALYFSDDGGSSFREILRRPAKLLGFALSPDGSVVLAGFGDPVDPSRFVDQEVLGIYRASTADLTFTKIYDGSVSCLAWTEVGLYACPSQSERGFSLGLAPDADFDRDVAEPFMPLLDLEEVRAPLECPACSTTGACYPSWPTTCALFGSCDAGVGGSRASEGVCAGTGGSSNSGSSGADFGGAGTGAGARPEEPRDDACGCRLVGARSATLAHVVMGLFIVFSCRRIRRRRESNARRAWDPALELL
jgi:hypothetical protein